jgi:hypothetical protein
MRPSTTARNLREAAYSDHVHEAGVEKQHIGQ